jgi:type I restriction enzyme, R subunit
VDIPVGSGSDVSSSNFGFLAEHDEQLLRLGALAERYFADDPPTSIVKLRQFAERMSKLIAAHHALYEGEWKTFEETLRSLHRCHSACDTVPYNEPG